MGTLSIMGKEGDTKIIWSPENEDEVRNARRTFDELTAKNYKAFAVKKDGEKGKRVQEFDPDAKMLILVPTIVGG